MTEPAFVIPLARPLDTDCFEVSTVKLRIRKSSLKARRQHGFRSKPGSYMKKKTKTKNLRLILKSRRKRK